MAYTESLPAVSENVVIQGDCVEVMAGLDAESVDAIVTDPPYNLVEPRSVVGLNRAMREGRTDEDKARRRGGFMGKSWDGDGVAFRAETWEAAYRVAKPSAYLLAFGGTRTVHRMTVALEDAGWIIRDMLVWAYASGFPKSKASLKPAWEPIVMARKPGPLRMLAIDECRIAAEPYSYPNGPKGNVDPTSYNYGRIETPVDSHPAGRWPANVILTDPIFDGGVEGVVGGGYQESTSVPGAWQPRGAFPIDNPEPRIYGDSGTYSRFFLIPKADRADREPRLHAHVGPDATPTVVGARQDEPVARLTDSPPSHGAREDSITVESAYSTICAKCGRQRVNVPGAACKCPDPEWVRKPQRPRRNSHPTVKPTELMRHLVRLVTPTGGLVLDPFLGSGTTAIAAELEGFRWLGIEKEAEYVAIAEARLNGTQRGLGLSA